MNTNIVKKNDEQKKLNSLQVLLKKINGGEQNTTAPASNSTLNMILIGVGILIFLILCFLIYKKISGGKNDSESMSLDTTPNGDSDESGGESEN